MNRRQTSSCMANSIATNVGSLFIARIYCDVMPRCTVSHRIRQLLVAIPMSLLAETWSLPKILLVTVATLAESPFLAL